MRFALYCGKAFLLIAEVVRENYSYCLSDYILVSNYGSAFLEDRRRGSAYRSCAIDGALVAPIVSLLLAYYERSVAESRDGSPLGRLNGWFVTYLSAKE